MLVGKKDPVNGWNVAQPLNAADGATQFIEYDLRVHTDHIWSIDIDPIGSASGDVKLQARNNDASDWHTLERGTGTFGDDGIGFRQQGFGFRQFRILFENLTGGLINVDIHKAK